MSAAGMIARGALKGLRAQNGAVYVDEHRSRARGARLTRAMANKILTGAEYPPCRRWPDTTPPSVRHAPASQPNAQCHSDNTKTAYPSHTIISMPALSPTMTAGNIGTWQKQPGDALAPGDVLVEIETDKAQMDFEFQEEGVLAKLLKESGEKDVAVGNVSLAIGY